MIEKWATWFRYPIPIHIFVTNQDQRQPGSSSSAASNGTDNALPNGTETLKGDEDSETPTTKEKSSGDVLELDCVKAHQGRAHLEILIENEISTA